MKRVAIIGGGIFGTTAAIQIARSGHEVHLFEEKNDILQAASAINQYRLHRGYHYPRSPETARSAMEAERSFRSEYAEAVIEGGRHLYAIAKEGSMVSGKEFLEFCKESKLEYSLVEVSHLVNSEKVEFVIEGVEARFDPDILREVVKRKLQESGVHVRLNTRAGIAEVKDFDRVVIASYAQLNSVLKELTDTAHEYQYEICEKPVVELPAEFGQTDLVIMDGPFMCVDPYGRSGKYVLGNVVHALHATNIGIAPTVPPALMPLLNAGIIPSPVITNFPAFIETGAPYIPMLKDAKHIGSLFTIRTVLPRMEATDARPTLVTVADERYIKIFSGKIGNCVIAAQEAAALI